MKCRLDASVCNNNNVGMMTTAGVIAKNLFTKVYLMRDLFGILVIASVNVINHVILVSVWTMKTESVGKN